MADDQITGALQENIISLLAHDDVNGKLVANSLDPALMEGDYRVIAEKCVEYWRQYGQAPRDHTADLVSDVLEDPHNRKANHYRRILANMLALSQTINAKYVMQQLQQFVRMQRMKSAIISSAEKLSSKQHHAISEVEDIWNDLLRTKELQFDPGLNLMDIDRVLDYLQVQFSEFDLGIPDLDRRNIVPYRGAILLFLGVTGAGKSWFLVHVGKRANMRRKKVVHISLEMSEEEVGQRYYQAIFSIPKRQQAVEVRTFTKDDADKVVGWEVEEFEPKWYFRNSDGSIPAGLRDDLASRVTHLGTRIGNIIIKRFPPRSLTINGLRAYLDNLELVERFIPDMLILDYIGITKTDARNHRTSLGHNLEEFRAVCIERNLAGVTANQVSKVGAHAQLVKATMVAEDWSLIATADQVMTFSSTDAENRFGLARLYVAKARSEQDKFGVLITQSYKTGQFVLESTLLPSDYFKILDGYDKGAGADAEDGDGDGGDD